MNEKAIRNLVESREHNISVEEVWRTPSGGVRKQPLYVAIVTNDFFGQRKELKDKDQRVLNSKIRDCIGKWNEQEIKARVTQAKQGAKAQAMQTTEDRTQEARALLESLQSILASRLEDSVDAQWMEELDRREYPPFQYSNPPPPPPAPLQLYLPPKPELPWLFKTRFRQWESQVAQAKKDYEAATQAQKNAFEAQMLAYSQNKDRAMQEYSAARRQFLSKQERYNSQVQALRERFRKGDPDAIVQRCTWLLKRSSYPEPIDTQPKLSFDRDESTLVVEINLPSKADLPTVSGYQFVNSSNSSKAISLKKTEIEQQHALVTAQIAVRTLHELVQACPLEHPKTIVLNAWEATLDPATGKLTRNNIYSLMVEKEEFRSFDLTRVDPIACAQSLKINTLTFSEIAS